jgi:hypothetical protein
MTEVLTLNKLTPYTHSSQIHVPKIDPDATKDLKSFDYN